MKNKYFILAFLTLTLLALGCSDKKEQQSKKKRYTTLRLVHDQESAPIVRKAVTLFGQAQPQLPDGSFIQLQLINKSGVAARPVIASGKLKTELWLSPSLALTNYANTTLTNLGPLQSDCVSLFSTPVVAAAAKNSLHTLFASEEQPIISLRKLFIGSDSLVAGTSSSETINFTHATPKHSTSGLSAYLQLAFLAIRLLEQNVETFEGWNKPLEDKLKSLELLSSGYASKDRELLLSLASKKNADREVVFTTEQQLVLFNKTKSNTVSRLFALYPEEQAVLQSYNLCRSKADWLTPAHQAAAKKFVEFMSSERVQLLAQQQGFRPDIVSFEDTTPVSAEYGANPAFPDRKLSNIPAKLTAGLQDSWTSIRKPAAVVFAIDTSGSMDGAPLATAAQEIRNLIAMVSKNDRMAIIRFSSKPEQLANFSNSARKLIQALDTLRARGGSAIYDSLRSAYELAENDKTLNNHSKIIVLVTDGNDKNSLSSLQSLKLWMQSSHAVASAQLYLIALTAGGTPDPNNPQATSAVDFSDLQDIAKTANAFYYEIPLAKISQPFYEIAQNF